MENPVFPVVNEINGTDSSTGMFSEQMEYFGGIPTHSLLLNEYQMHPRSQIQSSLLAGGAFAREIPIKFH